MFSNLLISCFVVVTLSITEGSTTLLSPQNGAIAADRSGPRFARQVPHGSTKDLIVEPISAPSVNGTQEGRGFLDGVGGLMLGIGGALAAQKIAKAGGIGPWAKKPAGSLVEDGDVTFDLYTKKNKRDPTPIKETHKTPQALENWKAEQPTIIIIHGWMETSTTPSNSAQRIKNAYLEENAKENIVLVDWSRHASTVNYKEASKSANQVAQILTDFVLRLVDGKFVKDYPDIHIVGFSLGGHIAGIVGNRIQKKVEGKKLGRITGLDVNWENYDVDVEEEKRLTADDASFVDVIHCCMGHRFGKFGTTLSIGTADFFPNGGVSQPDCDIAGMGDVSGICSTNKCYEYFANSITGTKYKACACADYEKYEANNCDCANSALMGEPAPTTAKGKYYLRIKA